MPKTDTPLTDALLLEINEGRIPASISATWHKHDGPIVDLTRRLERERGELIRAITQVLEDDESRPGGWGPDVTCVGILRDVLAKLKEG